MDEEFANAVLNNAVATWFRPESDRQGRPATAPIHAGVVVFAPGQLPQIRINDDVNLQVAARARRPVAPGEQVRFGEDCEVTHLQAPTDLPPDAGFFAFARVGEQVLLRFDFRQFRGSSAERIDRAAQFLETARDAGRRGLLAPAVENLWAAAELGATAHLLLLYGEHAQTRDHARRERLFENMTETGNAPAEHAETLARLRELRGSARYADEPLAVSHEELHGMVTVVEALITQARARQG
jgi:hypothetical protein